MILQTTGIQRRDFLRFAGVSVALPFLEGLPSILKGAPASLPPAPARRLVCVGNPYGMIPDRFFPKTSGKDYATSVLLRAMESHRQHFTVFSNFDHGFTGGHRVVDTFLTGVKTSEAKAMSDGNISIDQRAAEFVGTQTRFPVLNLGVGGSCEMSWLRSGVNAPVITQSREIFRQLFVEDAPKMKAELGRRHKLQGSILDVIGEHARSLNGTLGHRDREKLDEYFTSIRDLEKRLVMSEHWRGKPKPVVEQSEPRDGGFVESLPVYYDLMILALKTDSTRVITLEMPESFNTTELGLSTSYHGYSHHGQAPGLVEGLTIIEGFMVKEFSRFLGNLKATESPAGGTLLDETMVLFGSGMGNGSSHSNKNLPVMLAGGGFKHQGHLVLPEEGRKRVPLCNLYLTMLQKFGLTIDAFNASNSTIGELA